MLHVFIVTLAPGHEADTLLSEETLHETQAQVMTPDEARAVGFAGLPEGAGDNVRLIAVADRDARWVQRALESNHAVTSYRVKEVG